MVSDDFISGQTISAQEGNRRADCRGPVLSEYDGRSYSTSFTVHSMREKGDIAAWSVDLFTIPWYDNITLQLPHAKD